MAPERAVGKSHVQELEDSEGLGGKQMGCFLAYGKDQALYLFLPSYWLDRFPT